MKYQLKIQAIAILLENSPPGRGRGGFFTPVSVEGNRVKRYVPLEKLLLTR